MRALGLSLALLLVAYAQAFAGDYTLTLSGDSTAACDISFSTEAEAVDGIHPLQAGDITNFDCTIPQTTPALVLDENDLQYPEGLDYRVSGGKVVELDLQTTTANELQIGNAETNTLDGSWQLFGTGTLLNSPSNVVAIVARPASAGSAQYNIRLDGTGSATPVSFGLPMSDDFLDAAHIEVDGGVAQKSSCTTDLQGDTRFCRVAAIMDFSGGSVDAVVSATGTAEPSGASWTLDGDLPGETNMEVWAEINDLHGGVSGSQPGTWVAYLSTALAGSGTWSKVAAHDPGETIADGFIERAKANFSVPFWLDADAGKDIDGGETVHDNLRAYFDVYCYSTDGFSTVWGCSVDVKIRNGYFDCTNTAADTDCQDYWYSLAIKRLNESMGATETVASWTSSVTTQDLTVTDDGLAVSGSAKWDSSPPDMPMYQFAGTGQFSANDLGKIIVDGGRTSRIIEYVDANTVHAMLAPDQTVYFGFPVTITSGTAAIAGIVHEYASQVVQRVWWKNDPDLTIAHGVSSLLGSKMVLNYATPQDVASDFEADVATEVDEDSDNPASVHRSGATRQLLRGAIFALVTDQDADVSVLPVLEQAIITLSDGGYHPTDATFQKALYGTTDLWIQGAPWSLVAGDTGQVPSVFTDWATYYKQDPTISAADRFTDTAVQDPAHFNAYGYLPYLLTGRWVYNEALAGEIAYYFHDSVQSGGDNETDADGRAYFTHRAQPRSYMWYSRTLAQSLAITPPGAATLQDRAEMRDYFSGSWTHAKTEYVDDGSGYGDVCTSDGGPCRDPDEWLFLRSGTPDQMKTSPWMQFGYGGRVCLMVSEIGEMTSDYSTFCDALATAGYESKVNEAISDWFSIWGTDHQWVGLPTVAAVKAYGKGWDKYEATSDPPTPWDRCTEAAGLWALYQGGFGANTTRFENALTLMWENGDGGAREAGLYTLGGSGIPDFTTMSSWARECRHRLNIQAR